MAAPPTSASFSASPRASRVARGRRIEAAEAPDEPPSEPETPVQKAESRALKWSALRREILPSPALLKVSAKVQHIIETLKKPPEDRTEADVKLLYQWLMNQEKLSSLFTTMSEVSAKKLCKEMEFLHLLGGDVVVSQGDKGSTCFVGGWGILLSGLVSVFVRSPEEQLKHQRLLRSAASFRRLSGVSSLVNYGVKVVTLTAGATFGELCLIEPDSKRSATVIVDPQAQMANFIVLTAASYLRMTRSQTIEGTITDNIAFLQHLLLFKSWTKMRAFYLPLYLELIRLVFDVMGEVRGVQHSVSVELTFLGKFDVAGEYLAAESKLTLCPVDIRASTDVDCLVLTRKLFLLHFGGKDVKPHALRTRQRLRAIAEARAAWRETRVNQALQYPNLRVPITRKLMRLSGNSCSICGRRTHVAGDQLCMELPAYHMLEAKLLKREQQERGRSASNHRISIAPSPAAGEGSSRQASSAPAAKASSSPPPPGLPSLPELEQEQLRSAGRLGRQLVTRHWQEAERSRTTPVGARAAPLLSAAASVTRSSHVSKREQDEELQAKAASPRRPELSGELQRIRASWPYNWQRESR
ncbi:hypothetical protein BBJ28_00020273 [Nothophytophthora sp. Chile5]|nr:hypothetical protein BBJ28_00020273 [Nothophytophthora sp. Chile5]